MSFSLDADSPVKAAGEDGSRSLRLLKAYYFMGFCYFATFYRYMTLYFEADGLGASEIGFLLAVTRILTTIVTPFWGILADKTQRARTMSQVGLVVSVIPFLALAFPMSGGSRLAGRAAAFWIFSLCGSPRHAVMDALARAACKQDPDQWGQARVYGAIGWGLMHLVLGPLMDLLGFSVLFVSNVVFAFLLFVVTRSSVPEGCSEVRTEVTLKAVLDIAGRNRYFFFNVTAIGAGFAMVEGMLFLLLQEMKASTLLCGLSVVVTVVFELPIFHYANAILVRLGTRNMVLLGQAAWVVRALFYAAMPNAWAVLLIEPLHGVTFALVWTAAIQHVSEPRVAGVGLEASAQALLGVCFNGVGPMIGLFGGGLLFDVVGSHVAYAVFAVAVGGAGLIYYFCGHTEAESRGGPERSPSSMSEAQAVPLGRAVSASAADDEGDVDECSQPSPVVDDSPSAEMQVLERHV
eukprot:TRINITY_DN20133_c0_g2_i1.p1 TRINITY_DN20133_c0_g2~~TRINITY_DN20133_c0_g2_i1.p1  ORF type:complete len:463 (-),score=71.55 TRINITY_DN20133_c0_g2_i1:459-1847(-)